MDFRAGRLGFDRAIYGATNKMRMQTNFGFILGALSSGAKQFSCQAQGDEGNRMGLLYNAYHDAPLT